MNPKPDPLQKPLPRRQFLKLAGLAGASLILSSCQAVPDPTRTGPDSSATPPGAQTPSQAPLASATPKSGPGPAPSPTSPPTNTPAPTASPTPAWKALVATGRAAAYDPQTVRKELEIMLEGLGGLGSLLKPGARVGLKVNLTGGTWWDTPDKPPATEYFVTHPAVVGALCQLLRDAGAAQLTVMDGLGDETSFERWGYTAMAKPLNVKLVDLCKPGPYPDYGSFSTGPDPLIYPKFTLNRVLGELDLLISVAKLKVHTTTGVTLSLKNLIGLAPTTLYRRGTTENNRSAFHGDAKFDRRLPRVVIDLNRACPVHLAIIDGIRTSEGGAGPWDAKLTQIRPGLLLAGRSPLATDAAAAAVMGFNPAAADGADPFVGGENHLALANAAGLGTHQLAEIGIVGPPIADIQVKFKMAG